MAERQPLQLITSQDDGTIRNTTPLGAQGTMAIGVAAAIGSAFAALRVAQAPCRDFACEPQRPRQILSLPNLPRQHRWPSTQAPRANRSPSPRSPAVQSECAPSIRSCSQADDDDHIEELQVLHSPSPPRSLAACPDYMRSVCPCSQAGDDDWGYDDSCAHDLAYDSPAADAD